MLLVLSIEERLVNLDDLITSVLEPLNILSKMLCHDFHIVIAVLVNISLENLDVFVSNLVVLIKFVEKVERDRGTRILLVDVLDSLFHGERCHLSHRVRTKNPLSYLRRQSKNFLG